MDSHYIISIHFDRIYSIRQSSGGYSVAGILLVNWGADCVEIIPAEEERLAFESACEVQSSGKIAFGCSPIAEISDGYFLLTFYSEVVASPSCLWNLSPERRADGHII